MTGSKRGFLGTALLALVLPGVANAQGTAARSEASVSQIHTDQDAHEHDHGLHFSHPIFTESISPDRKLRLDGAGDFADEEDEWETELEAEWMFHRSFSIEVGVPYVFQVPSEGPSASALGSAEVTFKFANYAFEETGVLLGYGLGIGLPTGDGVVGSDHIWELEPFLNAGYKREALEAVAWARFGIPTNQNDGEEIETDLNYDVSVLYGFHPRFEGLLELNGTTVASGTESGTGTVFLGPGVKFAPLSAVPTLFVGVAGGLPLDQDEVNARLRVSLFYHY